MTVHSKIQKEKNFNPDYGKHFRQFLPLYPSEKASLAQDIKVLSKARKHEKKALEKCEQALATGVGQKNAQYLYLNSLRCLQANMLEANGRRPMLARLSLHQIIDSSKKYQILQSLNEPARVFQQPKSNGGWRPICDFGPVARGAQRMALKLLRLSYTPAQFQYTRLGVSKAIQEAIRLITKKGFKYAAELDITDHYPSHEEHALLKVLPLHKRAVREIILAKSADWQTPQNIPSYIQATIMQQISSGIPQGSAASAVVAELGVSQLKMKPVKGTALINYADNFFVFAKTHAAIVAALEALRPAIAGLPGGSFTTHPSPEEEGVVRHVSEGLPILGCFIREVDNNPDIEPTKSSLEELLGETELELQVIEAHLLAAKKEKDVTLRLDAVQKLSRMTSYINNWAAAHAYCNDISMIHQDGLDCIAAVREQHQISEQELSDAQDAFTRATYRPKSKLGG